MLNGAEVKKRAADFVLTGKIRKLPKENFSGHTDLLGFGKKWFHQRSL